MKKQVCSKKDSILSKSLLNTFINRFICHQKCHGYGLFCRANGGNDLFCETSHEPLLFFFSGLGLLSMALHMLRVGGTQLHSELTCRTVFWTNIPSLI